jgi:primosomal protein N' (replication factor Y) (superfamily II helicase)
LGANQSSRSTSQSARDINSLLFAKVVLDSAVPHLDREFDYAIAPNQINQIHVGSKVTVNFGRQTLNGWVVEKFAQSPFASKISEIKKVTGKFPTLKPNILQLARCVASFYAGNLSDVLRFTIPPRNAKAEKDQIQNHLTAYPAVAIDLSEIESGAALASRIGKFTQAAILLQRFDDWQKSAVALTKTAIAQKKNVLVVVPEHSQILSLRQRLESEIPQLKIAELSAEMPAAERYRDFLRIFFNQTHVVIGTRNAIFAPIENLGLTLVLNEYSDLYESPQAPYWQVSKVAQFRSELDESCLIYLGASFSVELYLQIKKGQVKLLKSISNQSQKVSVSHDAESTNVTKSRFSSTVWQILNLSKDGPVLVQVPRRGHAGMLRCSSCFRIATCSKCGGTLRIEQTTDKPNCARCGRLNLDFCCRVCKSRSYKVSQPGQSSILTEIGKMFPQRKLISSSGHKRFYEVDNQPSIIVSTPGAAPKVNGGYRSIVVLDAMSQFARPTLNVYQEVFNQWQELIGLLANNEESKFLISGDVDEKFLLYFLRSNVMGFLENELSQREIIGLPPIKQALLVNGPLKEINHFVNELKELSTLQTLGPVTHWDRQDESQIALISDDILNIVQLARTQLKVVSMKGKSSIRLQVNPSRFI